MSSRIAIQTGRLIDGTDRDPITQAIVLINEDRIEWAGRATEVPPFGPDVTRMAFPNSTMIPGLIDGHTHLGKYLPEDVEELPSFERMLRMSPSDTVPRVSDGRSLLRGVHNARLALQHGITTIQNCGERNLVDVWLRDGIRDGVVPGPRLHVSGAPITITGGHMYYWGGEADGIDGVRQQTRKLVKQGVDFIKVAATGGLATRETLPSSTSYTVEELQAIVDESHKANRRVMAHCLGSQGTLLALEARIDTLAHIWMMEPDNTFRFYPEIPQRMLEQGTYYCPTPATPCFRLDAFADVGEHRPLTIAEQQQVDRLRQRLEWNIEIMRRMIDAGIRPIAGTDGAGSFFKMGHYFTTLETFVEAGLSPLDTIRCATALPAEAMGIVHERGTLQQGMLADLVIVDGNPTTDIKALREIRLVILGGKVVHSGNA